jgi:Protein of unknown function (DUF3303)
MDDPASRAKGCHPAFHGNGWCAAGGSEDAVAVHSADGEFGFAIAESDDAQALTRWTLAWNDLLPMDVRPAVNDEGLGAVLQSP